MILGIMPRVIDVTGSSGPPLKEDESIYRYLGLDAFLYMLEMGALKFVRTEEWDDPHEGIGYRQTIKVCERIIKSRHRLVDLAGSIKKLSSETLENTFGTSWSLADDHDAMWRIYSSDKRGLMIKSTPQKIESSIKSISLESNCCLFYSIDEVKYRLQGSIKKDLAGWFHKRTAFDHEKEVRAVIRFEAPEFEMKKYSMKKAIYAPITSSFIDEVVIDPRADDWHLESVQSYCESKGIAKAKVRKSTLYEKWK